MAVQFIFQTIGVCSCTCGPIPQRWPRGWRAKQFIPLLSRSLEPCGAIQFSQLIGHFKATLRKFHVPFDADGGFQFLDVHDEAEALSFASTTCMGGTTKFVGGVDAAMVPCGDVLWPELIRMLFSWQHPGELQNMETVLHKVQLQLVGCLLQSNHPAMYMLVCTDGTNFVLFCSWQKGFIIGRPLTGACQATLHSMMQCA